MKTVKLFMILLAFLGLSVSAFAQDTYVIVNVSGTNFIASNVTGGETSGILSSAQAAINYVRTNADGEDCIIQFGLVPPELNLGDGTTSRIIFDGNWGEITLKGKATSTSSTEEGIIRLKDGISVISEAEITTSADNTYLIRCDEGATLTINDGILSSTGNGRSIIYTIDVDELNINGGTLSKSGEGPAINATRSTINISGGTVSSNSDRAIFMLRSTLNISGGTVSANSLFVIRGSVSSSVNISGGMVSATGADNSGIELINGLLNISGGTVSAYNGNAIYLQEGKISVSGDALVTSANESPSSGTIYLGNYGTDTDCRLEISGGIVENTATGGNAISNNSSGAIIISSGFVESTSTGGNAIYNYSTGNIDISGGVVLATTGMSISNQSTGKITISGNALILSENSSDYYGTIFLVDEDMDTGNRLEISGGTVKNTAEGGNAIFNNSFGKINISGGTVSATSGIAIRNAMEGTLNISGGTVSATTGDAINNSYGDININGGNILAKEGYAIVNDITNVVAFNNGVVFAFGIDETDVISGVYDISGGDGVLIAWNKAAGTTIYDAGTSNDIFNYPEAATVTWQIQSATGGIKYTNGANTGFIPIDGITVNTSGINQLRIKNYELRVFPNPTNGLLTISPAGGGKGVDELRNRTLSEVEVEIYDMMGRCVVVETWHALSLPHATIDISHLPSGIYFLKIANETIKIVKQ